MSTKIGDINLIGNMDQVVKKCCCRVSKIDTVSVMDTDVLIVTAGKRGSMTVDHMSLSQTTLMKGCAT